MATIMDNPPLPIQSDLNSLSSALDSTIPAKRTNNILIATWNIRKFGGLTREWAPTRNYSPKRDLRALRSIIEILSRFDVIAIQEVTGNLRALRDTIRFLGEKWSFVMTDITAGDAGNHERLAFIFNNERTQLSGLACEVVIPPEWINGSDPKAAMNRQFARTPYAVSFIAGQETFILLTAHIDYGEDSSGRVPELKAIAKWMFDWAKRTNTYHQNMVVLGDFNIDRHNDELWKAFTSTGLHVPTELHEIKRSIFVRHGEDPRRDKFYDQIAWFTRATGTARLNMKYLQGGGFDFVPYVYTDQNLSLNSISHRISDHYPLWVEFER
ncbi:MAG: endonuclease/exonuclease/phosphatase family protein [Candidatus Pacearchaeota archaeon]|nr:endonuclease/exonuclease/phosphatase family protein [Candidatus Pacearchaeota archaeon]